MMSDICQVSPGVPPPLRNVTGSAETEKWRGKWSLLLLQSKDYKVGVLGVGVKI